MSKVFLGVGHGGKDPGAVGYIKESDVNLNMALACKEYLEANGIQVEMSRFKDENDDLNEEIKECNAYDPDLAVDVHNNAGRGDGFEVYHSINGGLGKILASNIEEEVKLIGQNSRGCKTKMNSKGNADYYGFIRLTKCPAVIVEGVFVDNKADAAQADTLDEQKAFGIAYAKGIIATLKEMNLYTPITEQPEVTKSIDELAKEVIEGKWGVGEERKKKLGSLYDDVQTKVNEILKVNISRTNLKSINEIVNEVIDGEWGNGTERKRRLTEAGYDYNEIQKRVNIMLM